MEVAANKKIYFLSDFHLGAPNATEFYLAIWYIDDYQGTNAVEEFRFYTKRKITFITCNHHKTQAWKYWCSGVVIDILKLQVAI